MDLLVLGPECDMDSLNRDKWIVPILMRGHNKAKIAILIKILGVSETKISAFPVASVCARSNFQQYDAIYVMEGTVSKHHPRMQKSFNFKEIKVQILNKNNCISGL